ncbi:MAG: ferrous iron transport protein A [Ruminococcus sp.]|nr:ferrous iron transport protein A [Ruminococcus sp.]MDE7098184.1 ferrous iron transport protein A [Ruminococcus sp.]
MMPLTLANSNEDYTIMRIGGNPEVKRHLENLGFISGERISVINIVDGNLIVNVKETRVAISREMAQKIMI